LLVPLFATNKKTITAYHSNFPIQLSHPTNITLRNGDGSDFCLPPGSSLLEHSDNSLVGCGIEPMCLACARFLLRPLSTCIHSGATIMFCIISTWAAILGLTRCHTSALCFARRVFEPHKPKPKQLQVVGGKRVAPWPMQFGCGIDGTCNVFNPPEGLGPSYLAT